jgi:hypothetical protein
VRGDAIAITYDALSAVVKSTQKPLYEQLIASKVFSKDLADKVGLGIAPPPVTDSKVVADIKAGKTLVEFGDYTWKVLSVEGDKALLFSENIIDIRPYDGHKAEEDEDNEGITWEDSALRKYLNSDFYNSFSSSDKSQVLTTRVINADNAEWETPGGNDTDDKIFLLSLDEVNTYFSSDNERVAKLSTQAISTLHTIYQSWDGEEELTESLDEYDNAWFWWLRSPGFGSSHAAYVGWDGFVDIDGNYIVFTDTGVRPALYISLK